MRISDWSSDVCSSDLPAVRWTGRLPKRPRKENRTVEPSHSPLGNQNRFQCHQDFRRLVWAPDQPRKEAKLSQVEIRLVGEVQGGDRKSAVKGKSIEGGVVFGCRRAMR